MSSTAPPGVAESPRPVTLALVGPESTGKTTLARRLADALGGEVSAEAARAYVEARRAGGGTVALGDGDVEPIARAQLALEDGARKRARTRRAPLVVRDTDLVSTVVYARHYYGACPDWIVAAAAERCADLYLLCEPDAPWTPDPVRDASAVSAADRARLRDLFGATLVELGCPTVPVHGGWDERTRTATAAARALLDVGPLPRVRTEGAQ